MENMLNSVLSIKSTCSYPHTFLGTAVSPSRCKKLVPSWMPFSLEGTMIFVSLTLTILSGRFIPTVAPTKSPSTLPTYSPTLSRSPSLSMIPTGQPVTPLPTSDSNSSGTSLLGTFNAVVVARIVFLCGVKVSMRRQGELEVSLNSK
jgi:hypothetical protein